MDGKKKSFRLSSPIRPSPERNLLYNKKLYQAACYLYLGFSALLLLAAAYNLPYKRVSFLI